MAERTSALPIVIAGAGVGGLCAAVALARKGQQVVVLEQAEEIKPIGFGIQLGPNAFHMFEHLGLAASVRARCSLPNAGIMRDIYTLDEVTRIPFGKSIESRYGQPYAVIHRADLHEELLRGCAALPGIEIRTSAKVVGYEQQADRVQVLIEDGTRLDAGLLVGADGVHSRVRAQMCGNDNTPKSLGYVAYRGVLERRLLDADLFENDVVLWAGDGFHLMTYPLDGGDLFNIVAGFRSRRFVKGLEGAGGAEELDEIFANAHPKAQRLKKLVDRARHWDIMVMEPVPTWHDGRVALLGDSAHAMLQAMAQGACQAIEDAVWLAECLELHANDSLSALPDYQARRRLRAIRMQFQSRMYWEVYHAGGGYADLRRQMLQRSPNAALESLAWVYDRQTLPTEVPTRPGAHALVA